MTWRWVDQTASTAPDAERSVALSSSDGQAAGWLHVWPRGERPNARALRVDARIVSTGGPATWVSWCREVGDADVAFDDGAVTAALRRCLSEPWPVAISTALVDWSRLAGSLRLGVDRRDTVVDPFARLFPQSVFRVEPGLLGAIDPPTGPVATRYGSGNPWPWNRYAGQVT